ncbi:MAG: hypothetical protein OXT67_08250 [Zetaproteobacteria bacterium]|nr:hypothetical protein [Zetaproteobacteria bacterium]
MQTHSVEGKSVRGYAESIPQIRFPLLKRSLKACELSMEQAYKIAHAHLGDHLESTPYDRINYLHNIIKSFRNDLQPFQIRAKHLRMSNKINLAANSVDLPGGNCVFLTNRLNEQLPEVLRPNIIKSRVLKKHYQKGFPTFCHSATLIKCRDGYLLLDSGYGLARPIQLKLDGTQDTYQMGIYTWKYRLNRNHSKIIWEVYSKRGELVESTFYRVQYAGRLQKLHDDISTAAAHDLKPSCVFRDRDGFKTANIKVDLLNKKIKIARLWKRSAPVHISFGELKALSFEEKVAHLSQHMNQELCQRVQLNQAAFTRMVAFIVEHHDFIEERILTAGQPGLRRYVDQWMRLPRQWLGLTPAKLQTT